MKTACFVFLAGSLLVPTFALADVSYQEKTEITGGSMVGMAKLAGAFSSQAKQVLEPTTTTVAIHGDRMVRTNPHTTEIIDLQAQTITMIDHDKRTYSVVTFQQIQKQMAEVATKVKGPQSSTANGSQMTFDAHITSSGATRQLDGETAHETLLTITMLANTGDPSAKAGMAATSELWLIKDPPGMEEMHSFSQRMAKELSMDMSSSTAMSSLLATQPGGAQALEELKKESAKISGLPVLQVTRVGITPDGQPLAAPSVSPLPQNQNQGHSTASNMGKEVAAGTATQEAGSQLAKLGTFGRALGGSSMGALMGHAQPKTAPASATPVDPATAGVMMESQTATSGFSVGAVDTNSFQIPAGYKMVQSPMAGK